MCALAFHVGAGASRRRPCPAALAAAHRVRCAPAGQRSTRPPSTLPRRPPVGSPGSASWPALSGRDGQPPSPAATPGSMPARLEAARRRLRSCLPGWRAPPIPASRRAAEEHRPRPAATRSAQTSLPPRFLASCPCPVHAQGSRTGRVWPPAHRKRSATCVARCPRCGAARCRARRGTATRALSRRCGAPRRSAATGPRPRPARASARPGLHQRPGSPGAR